MDEFLSITFSPWSEKARWALDHHQVPYKATYHLPLTGELKLRARLRKFRGTATAPVLFKESGELLTDSWDIALHAEANGHGTKLFPSEHREQIAEWNKLSENASAEGRIQCIGRVQSNESALLAELPMKVPEVLRPIGLKFAKFGSRFLINKYESRAKEGALEQGLAELKKALDKSGGPTIYETFTYADIAMSAMLQFVNPVSDEWLRLSRRTRPSWVDATLSEKYPDLLQWRDNLYEMYRKN